MIGLLFATTILMSAGSNLPSSHSLDNPIAQWGGQPPKESLTKRRDRSERRERRSERREQRAERSERRPERNERSESRPYRSSRDDYRPSRRSESRDASRTNSNSYQYTIRERRPANRSGSSTYELRSRNQTSGARYDSDRAVRNSSSGSRNRDTNRGNSRPYEYTIRERRPANRSGSPTYVLRSRNGVRESVGRDDRPYGNSSSSAQMRPASPSRSASSQSRSQPATRGSGLCPGLTGQRRTDCLVRERDRTAADAAYWNAYNQSLNRSVERACRLAEAGDFAAEMLSAGHGSPVVWAGRVWTGARGLGTAVMRQREECNSLQRQMEQAIRRSR
jgi:hypothetical protein